jgi:hypothetical protein
MSQDTRYHWVSYAGTQEQAARLQRMTGRNDLDAGLLAEEVAGLGKREFRSLRSHLRQLLIHLLKLAVSPATGPKGHWRVEARRHQAAARDTRADSPGLSRHLKLPPLWSGALADARDLLADDGEAGIPADMPCPVAADDLLGACSPWTPRWRASRRPSTADVLARHTRPARRGRPARYCPPPRAWT